MNKNYRKMKKYFNIIFLFIATLCLTSCNDWLNVRSDTQKEEDDMFTTYKGFKDALTGCYEALAGTSVYGENMTMTVVDCLADMWYIPDLSIASRYYLTYHTYTNDYAKSPIKSMYSGLFNVIVQANMIIKHCESEGSVMPDSTRTVIEGEAYAMRAYCQLDVLRLFGQVPNNATTKVSLPYSETTSIDDIPSYYTYDEYVKKLESDIEKAISLLKVNDPVFKYGFGATKYSTIDDTYLAYRRFRFNYWAVLGLQARMYMYIGDTSKAYETAKTIIDGGAISMSGLSDLQSGYKACPNECLLALSKYNLLDYSVDLLFGESSSYVRPSSYYVISSDMYSKLFQGCNTASNNRYMFVWNSDAKTIKAESYPALLKYYYDSSQTDATKLLMDYQVIPMLRMSEIYLIAMETTTNLSEANSMYKTYMEQQNELIDGDTFASLDEVKAAMPAMYLREFYGEGQMFYAYKRWGTTSLSINGTTPETMDESKYIVPLPDSEYNPNNLK
jgi:hypothetical protein